MSFIVPNLSRADEKHLAVYDETSDKSIPIYTRFQKGYAVPFEYGRTKRNKASRKVRPRINSLNFNLKLRKDQIDIEKQALKSLRDSGSTLLCLYTGFGKTITSLAIASKIRRKTIILVNSILLLQQWQEVTRWVLPQAKVKVYKSSTFKSNNVHEDADIGIINAQNVSKLAMILDVNKFEVVIVDEVHNILCKTLTESLFYLQPKYLIGLSATPFRYDSLDSLFEMFFSRKITLLLNRLHHVTRINTGVYIPLDKTSGGSVDWNKVIQVQSDNVSRDVIIKSLIDDNPDRYFLVLVKRVQHAKRLVDFFGTENCDRVFGSYNDTSEHKKILVGTVKKSGVGFDCKKLDALILASDISNYFVQILGRVFRRPEVVPIVFDLVDDNFLLWKHFQVRCEVYENHGGKFHQDLSF